MTSTPGRLGQRALQRLVFVLLLLAPSASCLPLYEFFPFGVANGDTLNPTNDDGGSGLLSLGANFPFFNRANDRLYVNNNGIISFLSGLSTYTPSSFPLNDQTAVIAPFWADVDLRIAGTASHRESTNRTLLALASEEIRSYFPDFRNFSATWLYIATWNDTAFYGATGVGTQKRNTFQCVLVTDGVHSFAILNYYKIEWLTGTASDGIASTGMGGTMANAGFNAGDRHYYASVQGAMTPAMLNLPSTSNVGIGGKWVYRVDLARIELPPSPPSTRAPPTTTPFMYWTSTQRPLSVRDAIGLKCGSTGFDVSVNIRELQNRERTDVTHIILGTSDCNGSVIADTLHFTAKYGDCQSTVKTFGDWLEFAVPLFYREGDPGTQEVEAVRWSLGLTCRLRSSEVDSALLPGIHFNNSALLNSTYVGSFATVELYTDSAFTQPLTSSPELGQTIFARVTSSLKAIDGTILVVRNCSVLPDNSSHATPPSVLLRESCEVHSHTQILATRSHETRFRFDAFGFTQGGAMRVSCDVRMCSDSDFSDQCSQRCMSRPGPPPPADLGDVTRAHVIVLFEREARQP